MSRRKTNDVAGLIIISFILIKYMGFKASINLLYQMFKLLNTILLQFSNTSILSHAFKYCITFPIVGIVLSFLGSPRGKKGHIIGKILYFSVGYISCFILDLIAKSIF